MSRWCQVLLLALLWLPAAGAHAEVRAWLDRDRIAFGETATLNIESDRVGVDAPDYAALERDFRLSGHTSRRSIEMINGRSASRTLFAVALQPRREGVIGLPAIRVGADRTQPLALTVTPVAASPARAGETVFIETQIDDAAPYVQQSVGVLVRLYYAVPLISGQLDLPPPEGASLQRVGEDVQYTREAGGRRYTVLERRFLLVPERSGELVLPGARFEGRGAGGFFDDLFNDGAGQALRAAAAPQVLQVQPIPAGAAQPWLPLHGLRMRYVATPQSVRAGAAATVVVEVVADGASAAQMPELQLPVGAGAQVFADPAQADERFRDGRPQVTVTRRFSVVPGRAGSLRIEGPVLEWWDVRSDAARTATLPALVLEVAPGTGGAGAVPAAPVADVADGGVAGTDRGGWIRVPGVQGEVRFWALATVVFALLWLLTLGWGLHRGAPATTGKPGPAPVPARPTAAFRRALDGGDLGEVTDALHALAPMPARDLAELGMQLDDPAQRTALEALQQARWGDGDVAAARAQLRGAFARGPRWRTGTRATTPPPLPPLYPP